MLLPISIIDIHFFYSAALDSRSYPNNSCTYVPVVRGSFTDFLPCLFFRAAIAVGPIKRRICDVSRTHQVERRKYLYSWLVEHNFQLGRNGSLGDMIVLVTYWKQCRTSLVLLSLWKKSFFRVDTSLVYLFLVGDDLKVEKMVRTVRLHTAKIIVFYAILAVSSAVSSFNRIRLSAGWLIFIMMVRTGWQRYHFFSSSINFF